ncbi:hypothetical protein AMTR_s00065p00084890 [Amborella trichopoda]|uniref:Uncharacterized protein n=1 Tax=Amborella trichopoda TaxID=13333 RepID=U5DAV3_AMBTC|nr:hypothetical protein AMTR_s00065p00084890 [Amborella trichopoda]
MNPVTLRQTTDIKTSGMIYYSNKNAKPHPQNVGLPMQTPDRCSQKPDRLSPIRNRRTEIAMDCSMTFPDCSNIMLN